MASNLAKTTKVDDADVVKLVHRALVGVREDIRDNPYIDEAIRVLSVQGYRSAIGCFWNAVIDDLRKKVIHRSLSLFNKAIPQKRQVKAYEDFQEIVNDDDLIEGSYKIGVIGWEASKILKHAKETRHIFDGHPKSSNPSVIKVLAMLDDCIKYVLNEEFPHQIVDLEEYMSGLNSSNFDRNTIAIESALGDLPEVYKTELANRLYGAYCNPGNTSAMRSNIEFVVPIVWPTLPRETKQQVIRRVDQELSKGNAEATTFAFQFAHLAGSAQFLSITARRYKIEPLIEKLSDNDTVWKVENETIKELAPYAGLVPPDLLTKYVHVVVRTYIGHVGSSAQFSRTDFYADGAAQLIPTMVEAFDDRAAEAFVEYLKSNKIIRRRIRTPSKLRRLRILANIVNGRVSRKFPDQDLLNALVDENAEESLWSMMPKLSD